MRLNHTVSPPPPRYVKVSETTVGWDETEIHQIASVAFFFFPSFLLSISLSSSLFLSSSHSTLLYPHPLSAYHYRPTHSHSSLTHRHVVAQGPSQEAVVHLGRCCSVVVSQSYQAVAFVIVAVHERCPSESEAGRS